MDTKFYVGDIGPHHANSRALAEVAFQRRADQDGLIFGPITRAPVEEADMSAQFSQPCTVYQASVTGRTHS